LDILNSKKLPSKVINDEWDEDEGNRSFDKKVIKKETPKNNLS
jgi:hypothetical protein